MEVTMASSKEYLDYILEQLSPLDEITSRPMMGEYIIYYRGKMIGGIGFEELRLPAAPQILRCESGKLRQIPLLGRRPVPPGQNGEQNQRQHGEQDQNPRRAEMLFHVVTSLSPRQNRKYRNGL